MVLGRSLLPPEPWRVVCFRVVPALALASRLLFSSSCSEHTSGAQHASHLVTHYLSPLYASRMYPTNQITSFIGSTVLAGHGAATTKRTGVGVHCATYARRSASCLRMVCVLCRVRACNGWRTDGCSAYQSVLRQSGGSGIRVYAWSHERGRGHASVRM